MSLDRDAATRRRFARALGTNPDLGSGLPIGTDGYRGRDRSADAEEEGDAERAPVP